jgi:DNA transposition AAA+ family ATPase
MRTSEFVQTSGAKAFLGAVSKAQQRGAREASWIAVKGERGLGKTRTLKWWAVRQSAVYLRFKADWTARWMLEELARELGLSTDGNRKQDLFLRVVEAVRNGQIIIVLDEVELLKVRGKIKLLETLRDISDLTEMEVILAGDEAGINHVMRYDQFASRVASRAQFGPATEADIRLMCEKLSEVAITNDLAAEILRQSGGYLREAKNAIAEVERWAAANDAKQVNAADMAGRALCAGRSVRRGA